MAVGRADKREGGAELDRPNRILLLTLLQLLSVVQLRTTFILGSLNQVHVLILRMRSVSRYNILVLGYHYIAYCPTRAPSTIEFKKKLLNDLAARATLHVAGKAGWPCTLPFRMLPIRFSRATPSPSPRPNSLFLAPSQSVRLPSPLPSLVPPAPRKPSPPSPFPSCSPECLLEFPPPFCLFLSRAFPLPPRA